MTPSTMIAHYRIVSKIGEGGMGAVYRAVDTRLSREVAIKVLPDALANDSDYIERFTREAQVLASLSHPNIAIIHGVENRALIMELVPGDTLGERIAAGPLPLEEALDIARQIAEALEAAHERGVIHRDLKPANVKVTPEGVAKVLDFGLAKAADPAASSSAANSPTLTLRATQAGVILGTAGYMAPEQAVGKPVDRRADIWSFGVVLYEMLTGRALFSGETISHTLAAVLKDPIDFDVPQAPPPVRRLLARCLTRNPKDRLRDIGEARIAIREYLAHPEVAPASAPGPRTRRRTFMAIAAGTVAVAAGAATLAWNFRPAPPAPVTRFRYELPEGQTLTAAGRSVLAVSPDGSQIAYVANRRIFVRSMAELDARPLPGTESSVAVTNLAYSPDGKSLAYFESASQTLKRIPVSGGASVTVCAAQAPYGFDWAGDAILIAQPRKGILRVSANGGVPELLVPAAANEAITHPALLPGGRAVLFETAPFTGSDAQWDDARVENARVVAQDLKSGVRKVLVQNGGSPAFLPTGHITYTANGVLFAVPFDPRRLEVTGPAVAVVEGVARWAGYSQYAFSRSGSLAYIPGPVVAGSASNEVLALVDRSGAVERLKLAPAGYAFPRVSRDGKRVAYQIDEGKESAVWTWELSGQTAPRRLTLPGAGLNRYPIWSADGERVTFQSSRDGDPGIWWQRADGSAPAERLTRAEGGAAQIPDSWSPDGRTLSFTEEKNNSSAVRTYSLREKTTTALAEAPQAYFGRSAFSPDGRWIAYQQAMMPNSRIYVQPFPPTGSIYAAPEDADSHHPAWSSDGKELFYVCGPSQFGSFAVLAAGSVISFGPPVRFPTSGFETSAPALVRKYDVLPGGKRFIGVVPALATQAGSSSAPQIDVVLNWFEDVKQRAPVR